MRFKLLVILVSLMLLVACASEQNPQGEAIKQIVGQQTSPETQAPTVPAEPQEDVPLKEIIREEPTITEQEKVQKTALALSDGIYTQAQEYSSLGGKENFELTVEVKENIVQSVSLKSLQATPTAVTLQAKVGKELPALMVGKNIADIQLPSKISGSSLTPPAVQKALQALLS